MRYNSDALVIVGALSITLPKLIGFELILHTIKRNKQSLSIYPGYQTEQEAYQ
jgi:hypothetical protein